ncbi:hypothetical protein BD408DRAFT_332977, partial [Parasitella parasitica]
MFCTAAVCCGVFIGGCAGFAAEAFSSILITATWGPQAIKGVEQEENVELVEGLAKEDGEKEKEPLIPRVESWRDSLSISSTSSSPVLIRRMKLSSTDRKDSWEWDEETEE